MMTKESMRARIIAKIVAALGGESSFPAGSPRYKALEAFCDGIIEEIHANAVVTVTTTCGAGAGSGTGGVT